MGQYFNKFLHILSRTFFTPIKFGVPPSSTVEGDGQRKSEVLEDKRDSPEGADTVASELQRLSLVKKAGEKMLQQLSMKNPLNLSPLTALIQSKP